MTTEDVSLRYRDLDLWPTLEAGQALYEAQLAAVAAVGPALADIAAAADAAALRLARGGRLVYVGAGTSARIGVQDGAELPPTFNWPQDRLVFAIAGGEEALLRAVENAEDSGSEGAQRMIEIQAGVDDVVIGLAASGATPFTVAALRTAQARGALTVGVANNPACMLLDVCEHAILIDTGAEAIAGSTRLKAGTAQKVVLNLFSTLVMTRLGHVYQGLMVNMRATNDKLRRRSVQMVVTITGCTESVAAEAVAGSGGELKVAALIARGLVVDAARALLAKHGGNLRGAMSEVR